MTLQDIFDQLGHGELVSLRMGGAGEEDGIREEDKPKLLSNIQLGLTALYKRFRLKEGEVIVQLADDRQLYEISSRYAASNDKATLVYLDDALDPFDDSLLKIEEVYDADGVPLALNKRGDADSLRTPSYNKLQVPSTLERQNLRIVYRRNHPKIDKILGPAVSFAVELELPDTHLEPLLYFVASRIMNPIGMVNEYHDGNNYAAKYEMACRQLEDQGHYIDDLGESSRFSENGWV